MYRRSLLRRLTAAVVIGVCAVAGCLSGDPSATGPRTPPWSPTPRPGGERTLFVSDFRVEEDEDGDLAVPVTVRNEADDRREGTVVGEVSVDGESTRVTESASVAAESTTALTLEFDVDYRAFVADGSLTVRVE